jgi:hypothetical protein
MYLRPNLIVIGKAGSDTPKSLEHKAASPVRADASQKSREDMSGCSRLCIGAHHGVIRISLLLDS